MRTIGNQGTKPSSYPLGLRARRWSPGPHGRLERQARDEKRRKRDRQGGVDAAERGVCPAWLLASRHHPSPASCERPSPASQQPCVSLASSTRERLVDQRGGGLAGPCCWPGRGPQSTSTSTSTIHVHTLPGAAPRLVCPLGHDFIWRWWCLKHEKKESTTWKIVQQSTGLRW